MEIYQSIFESCPDALLLVNDKGSIDRLNGQAARLFGYERDELGGKPLDAIVPGCFRMAALQFGSPGLGSPGLGSPEFGSARWTGKRRDSTEFPLEIAARKVEPGKERELWLFTVYPRPKRPEAPWQTSALEDLRATERIARLGSWTWDLATSTVRWSEQLYRHVGMDPHLPAAGYEEQANFYTEES